MFQSQCGVFIAFSELASWRKAALQCDQSDHQAMAIYNHAEQ